MTDKDQFRCGYVALVGRPNVGKSTMLNYLIGQKISITSPKPQTTRHRVLGIRTREQAQIVYVDTPGMHLDTTKALNRYMEKTASSSIFDVDVVVMVADCYRWTEEDEHVLEVVKRAEAPVILALNKVDTIKNKEELLPKIQEASARFEFAEVFPVSAYNGTNLDALEQKLMSLLPQSLPFYDENQVTDRSERFLAAEMIREKLMRKLGKEVPYSLAVEIEAFTLEGKLRRINAIIWVERKGQKKIVIGKGGSVLKDVGKQARIDMENLFGGKVYLELWVKVREGWSDDERVLRSLGYDHDR